MGRNVKDFHEGRGFSEDGDGAEMPLGQEDWVAREMGETIHSNGWL
jgi:hypothetical protein